MGRITTMLAVGGLVLGAAADARAQCAFDAPAKAKVTKSSLVRAYAACPGVTFAAPNTSTMAGVPGCTPPTASSLYEFDEKGSCSVRLSHSAKTPCPDAIAASCSVVTIVTKCRGILDPGGSALTNAPGWTLNLVHRATTDDDPNGDMTVVDVPFELALPDAANGKLKSTFDFGSCVGICPIFGPSNALPACTQIEILRLTIRDPDGNAFATLGSSGR